MAVAGVKKFGLRTVCVLCLRGRLVSSPQSAGRSAQIGLLTATTDTNAPLVTPAIGWVIREHGNNTTESDRGFFSNGHAKPNCTT